MLPSTDHSVLELGAVVRDDVLEAPLLKFDCGLEVLANDLLTQEVQHCPLQELVTPAHFQHVVDEAAVGLELLLNFEVNWPVGHVLKHEHVLEQALLFEELGAVLGALRSVDHHEAKALLERHLCSDVVGGIDGLDQLEQLAEVALAALL